ncbi:TIM barrel protein [Roseivirga sp. UBA838]|uniref:hydroxypyruvate isomerase family protein n=1 Tax=Roseivirga sp. UBA838 TaxID=1947393 RepID=UPI00257A9EBD|nr:TIM barrel protein [Roseivirga sp. UBA838]|tara:strand:+ start:23575 stop:24480 length:906 start_codon:yes stop_codon:yes gene_type:complete
MDRRKFLGSSLLASALSVFPHQWSRSSTRAETFQLNYAPHFGMFRHSAPGGVLNELDFMAEHGFRSLEDNDMKKRPLEQQRQIAARMEKHNMQMGVFVAHTIFWTEPNLASGKAEGRDLFLKEIQESVEVAKRVNAKWMTVVPGHLDLRKDMGYQTAHVVESLKRAAEILEPHGLVMVLEPLNKRDHPGLFLTKAAQAYEICKAVDSPSCKILFDIYHQQITEGNLIPNIEASWEEIAYFQVGDNPGRREPTTGEINYLNVFKHIYAKGFNGIIGMEHGNSRPGADGEMAVIEAYRKSDSF